MVRGFKHSESMCRLLENVKCPNRKNKDGTLRSDSYLMAVFCVKCSHYHAFIRMMDEEDEKENAEVEAIFSGQKPY